MGCVLVGEWRRRWSLLHDSWRETLCIAGHNCERFDGSYKGYNDIRDDMVSLKNLKELTVSASESYAMLVGTLEVNSSLTTCTMFGGSSVLGARGLFVTWVHHREY
jgi:hypothetical protein